MHVLVLEDEPIIGFTLEDILLSLGCSEVSLTTTISGANQIVNERPLDVAILDVNIHGTESYPVADQLADWGVPYIFATGYGARPHPDRHKNVATVEKPYSTETLGLRSPP